MLAIDPPALTGAGVQHTVVTLSLARRAERFPDRAAVVDVSEERRDAPAETIHESRVSYGELSAMATRTAEHLSALGIAAGDVVCLVTRNRVASLAVLFACHRLGAVFAPISHWLTPATVTRPFEAIDPDLVVSESAQRDLVRSIPFDRSITLAELVGADRENVPDTEDRDHDTDVPLLFLHGDGGRPVAGYTAHTLEWNCLSALVSWNLSSDDVAPLTTPLSSYDGLVRAALPLLYVGGTVLLDRAFDPGDTLTAVEENAATFLAGRGTQIAALAAEPGFDAAIDSLERVVLEGAVDDEIRVAYREHDASILRAYGRLECPTVFSQSVSTDGADSSSEGVTATADVGRPVPDCRVRLVDDEGAVLEGPAEGRLRVSGPVVADGYVTSAGTDDESWDASTEERHAEDDESGDSARFEDGWLETGDRFGRDEYGIYWPQ